MIDFGVHGNVHFGCCFVGFICNDNLFMLWILTVINLRCFVFIIIIIIIKFFSKIYQTQLNVIHIKL